MNVHCKQTMNKYSRGIIWNDRTCFLLIDDYRLSTRKIPIYLHVIETQIKQKVFTDRHTQRYMRCAKSLLFNSSDKIVIAFRAKKKLLQVPSSVSESLIFLIVTFVSRGNERVQSELLFKLNVTFQFPRIWLMSQWKSDDKLKQKHILHGDIWAEHSRFAIWNSFRNTFTYTLTPQTEYTSDS